MEFSYTFQQWDLAFGNLVVTVRGAASFDGKGVRPDEIGERIRTLPIGASVWPSALVLADVLAAEPALVDGKRVLELGSGVGLGSVVAAKLGAHVTASDLHADMRELVGFNARLNGVHVDYTPYTWESETTPGEFDVVIGSDVLYEAQQCNTVLDALERTLSRRGTAIITDPGRKHLDRFAMKAEARGFHCTHEERKAAHPSWEPVLALHPSASRPFHVFRLTRTP